MLPTSEIEPSNAISLKSPAVKSLKDEEGFLNTKRSGKTIRVSKIGICTPALADKITDIHAYPNKIHTALILAPVTVAGNDPLVHWLKLASLGATNVSSRASALSITLRVCNKFPTTTALDTVHNGLGEEMERKQALGYLFDMVLTLPHAKPDQKTTNMATMIDTNVLNVHTGLLSQPPPESKTTDMSQFLQLNQVNIGPGLLNSATQVQHQLQLLAQTPVLTVPQLQPFAS